MSSKWRPTAEQLVLDAAKWTCQCRDCKAERRRLLSVVVPFAKTRPTQARGRIAMTAEVV